MTESRRKQPKTLSGIETCRVDRPVNNIFAGNNLKPYQGLKPSGVLDPLLRLKAGNNLKPYQGLKLCGPCICLVGFWFAGNNLKPYQGLKPPSYPSPYSSLGLKTSLLPTLVTAQVVVIDNLTFDKSGRIQELIQTAGCRLLYLPPYSPEFNKIEQRRVLAKKSNS